MALRGGSPRPGFVLPVSMRHSCDWFFWRYRCRFFYRAIGQPFGSSPLGLCLLRRERCPKKTRRFFLRAVGGVVWASAYVSNLALAHKHTSFIVASACKISLLRGAQASGVQQQLCHSTDSQHR